MSVMAADPVAFRTVFADPGEKLVLAIVDVGQGQALSAFAEVIEELRRNRTAVKLVVFGDTSAILPDSRDAGFVEGWARPVLPALLEAADLVIPLSGESGSLLSGRDASTIVRSPDELRDRFISRGTRTAKRFVLQNDWGFGDELLLSAVAREIVRAHPDAEIWIRSRFGFRFPSYVQREPIRKDAKPVETIYQNAILYGPSHHSPFPGHLVDQMLDKVALDTSIRVRAADVRPELEIPPTRRTPEPTVVLHSGTNPRLPSKDWGIGRWATLAKILSAAGVRMRQIGAQDEPLLQGADDLRGTPVRELPELIASSWAVVCVVGLLMHLAEAAKTPAVVIYGGREHPAIDGYPDQVHLSSEALPCRGRWGCHLGPDLECPHGMKCMERLSPELVAREVLSVIARGAR